MLGERLLDPLDPLAELRKRDAGRLLDRLHARTLLDRAQLGRVRLRDIMLLLLAGKLLLLLLRFCVLLERRLCPLRPPRWRALFPTR